MMKVSPSDLEINCILLQPPIRGLFIAGLANSWKFGGGFGGIFAFSLAGEGIRTWKTLIWSKHLCC